MIKLNNKEVVFGTFPNNEVYLNTQQFQYVGQTPTIVWVYENDVDFFKLLLLKEYLDVHKLKTSLHIQYMPHSRMDRASSTYVLSLRVATKLINDMDFHWVSVIEPHSDVTPALLTNTTTIHWCQNSIPHVLEYHKRIDSLFFPDAGAAKRYTTSLPYAVGHKKRDFSSGKIINFSLVGDVLSSVLIVDDLCSKGGTFIHSAKLLKKHGATKITLLVANCEKTILTGDFFNHIDYLIVPKCHTFLKNHPQVHLI